MVFNNRHSSATAIYSHSLLVCYFNQQPTPSDDHLLPSINRQLIFRATEKQLILGGSDQNDHVQPNHRRKAHDSVWAILKTRRREAGGVQSGHYEYEIDEYEINEIHCSYITPHIHHHFRSWASRLPITPSPIWYFYL